ncbi:MAG: hypothetical protein GC199_09680 [Alphaproteobacteria bacterium]|nr:hypothetical protein [Alphaproteobacteria bacterium]
MSVNLQSGRVLRAAVVFCALASAAPARADQPPGGLVVDEETCRTLAVYDAANAPTYQPGITADGRMVAPADLGGVSGVPPVVFIGIEAPIERRGTFRTETPILTLALDLATGAVTTLDGQPVAGLGRADVVAACNTRASILGGSPATP